MVMSVDHPVARLVDEEPPVVQGLLVRHPERAGDVLVRLS